MLETSNLSVFYGRHRALENVGVAVAPGEIRVILGANGAGKSTLLKAVAGMTEAEEGSRISVDGRQLSGLKPHQIVEQGIALVPEGRGIFGDLTVAENLQLGAHARRARGREAETRKMVLSLFPRLEERRGQIARTMSGGEQQMVAIGRALMSNPQILMLDEPSLGLSPLLSADLFKALRKIAENGVGILLVEQNARQSLAIADHGYLIENGRITGEDTAARLAADPAVKRAFLGGVAADARGQVSAEARALADDAPRLAARATRILRAHVYGWRAGPVPREPSADATRIAAEAALAATRAGEILRQHIETRRAGGTTDRGDTHTDIRNGGN